MLIPPAKVDEKLAERHPALQILANVVASQKKVRAIRGIDVCVTHLFTVEHEASRNRPHFTDRVSRARFRIAAEIFVEAGSIRTDVEAVIPENSADQIDPQIGSQLIAVMNPVSRGIVFAAADQIEA